MSEPGLQLAMKSFAPDGVFRSPRVRARHRERPACGLESPLGPAHEAARRIRLVELERMQMLPPHPVRAPEVIVEQTHDRSEGMKHQPPADQAGGIRQSVGKPYGGREQ